MNGAVGRNFIQQPNLRMLKKFHALPWRTLFFAIANFRKWVANTKWVNQIYSRPKPQQKLIYAKCTSQQKSYVHCLRISFLWHGGHRLYATQAIFCVITMSELKLCWSTVLITSVCLWHINISRNSSTFDSSGKVFRLDMSRCQLPTKKRVHFGTNSIKSLITWKRIFLTFSFFFFLFLSLASHGCCSITRGYFTRQMPISEYTNERSNANRK